MSAVPLDQASRLRDLMALNAPRAEAAFSCTAALQDASRAARVIAVASGKGGVGKTNVSVNLGICLARRGLRVVLIDADLGTANVDVLMKISSPYDLSHVVVGRRSVDDVLHAARPGLRVLRGASGMSAVADLDPRARGALIEQLTGLESACDVILLDCGAGISQNVVAFAAAADDVLVVLTPEPPAMTDAYALIKAMHGKPARGTVGLLVNQVSGYREGRECAERVAGVARRFLNAPVEMVGQIPRDGHVSQAVRMRVPVVERYPRSPASHALAILAERLEGRAVGLAGRHGFFHRVMRFFC
ncbi:Flagellum site-determining protein YlxH [Phycisphaerae bacterium RAS2]|nr:Flagellum site-determining protein YlxH [Phycisphaerae bacterium RAS2]